MINGLNLPMSDIGLYRLFEVTELDRVTYVYQHPSTGLVFRLIIPVDWKYNTVLHAQRIWPGINGEHVITQLHKELLGAMIEKAPKEARSSLIMCEVQDLLRNMIVRL